jgi:hypothetical protein
VQISGAWTIKNLRQDLKVVGSHQINVLNQGLAKNIASFGSQREIHCSNTHCGFFSDRLGAPSLH